MFALTRKLVGIASLVVLLAPAARASTAPPSASAESSVPVRASASRAAAQVLPWIEDDYTRAIAQARARKLPIFVESWAPW